MSKENVDLVRRLYAEGGPFALPMSPDAERGLLDRLFAEYYEEQVEVRMPADYPEGAQVFVGRRGMSELIAVLSDSWTKWHFEAERFIDAGDRVIVFIRVVAEGGASGLTTERETAHVWVVRDGRLASIQIYRDRSEAIDAVASGGTAVASAELSHRVTQASGYPPLSELSAAQRDELREELLEAESFDDLPGKWQAAILTAEAASTEAR